MYGLKYQKAITEIFKSISITPYRAILVVDAIIIYIIADVIPLSCRTFMSRFACSQEPKWYMCAINKPKQQKVVG